MASKLSDENITCLLMDEEDVVGYVLTKKGAWQNWQNVIAQNVLPQYVVSTKLIFVYNAPQNNFFFVIYKIIRLFWFMFAKKEEAICVILFFIFLLYSMCLRWSQKV